MESSDGTAIPDMLRSAKPPRRTVAAEESEEDVEEEEEGEEGEEEEEEETGSGIDQGEVSD
jgi:ribosomal protein L12E/L44/L45/RPP1/RPP2